MTSSSEVCVNLSSSSPFAVAAMNEMRNPVLLFNTVHARLDSCCQLEGENACAH